MVCEKNYRETIFNANEQKYLKFTCKWCKQEKLWDQFRRDRYSSRGVSYECKECKSKYDKTHPKKYTDNTKLHIALKKTHNMTISEYRELYEKQDGKCAICKNPAPLMGIGRLHVDHCHKTGTKRELLCHSCNSLIGFCKEDINRLEAARLYLIWWHDMVNINNQS